ncbi:MAG: sigma-70 family RNA polymerase sigma factor [Anaerolineales bacterium]|nr:sigma-70 family RNA polymerase sigma factor [Anaerolineales bacterium]
MDNEAEIVARAQAGDAGAFELLVVEHQSYVFNLAFRVLGNEQEAEDTAQEAFVRAWQALPRFRGQSKFGTWLYRIVTNLCYNRLPRLRREFAAIGEEEIVDHPDPRTGDPDQGLENSERRAWLHRQIEALPETYRLLVTLRYQRDLPYEEIASITSLPMGTVKTGLFRAKEKLRSALETYEEVRQ